MRVFFRRSSFAFYNAPGEQDPKSDRAEKDDQAKPEARAFRRFVQSVNAARGKPNGEQRADRQINKSGVNDDFSVNHNFSER